jgi:hypothetical protein
MFLFNKKITIKTFNGRKEIKRKKRRIVPKPPSNP